jgi:hypothetical protein
MKTPIVLRSAKLPYVLGLYVSCNFFSSCGQNPAFQENTAGNAADVSAQKHVDSADKDEVGPEESVSCEGHPDKDEGNHNDGDAQVGGAEGGVMLLVAEDTATMTYQSKVDILWVVDSSGSMAEEQSYLGSNFNSFISKLSTSGLDFQTGVTTTDICASKNPTLVPAAERYCPTLDGSSSSHYRGSLVGTSGKRVLKPTTADLNSRFLNYANVGTNGSGYEHGLKAAEMAVTKSLNGDNEGLVRNDAFLAVIVVSDEEDDGIGLGITDQYSGKNFVKEGLTSVHYTENNLIDYLQLAKGAGKFSVSTITGTRLANGQLCTSSHSQPKEAGTQYIAAANKTGGIVQSICDNNWSASLANIGQDISGQSSQIVLSHDAYDGTIKVYVNGVLNNDWSYHAGNHTIKFAAGKLPPEGAKVKVSYSYAAK